MVDLGVTYWKITHPPPIPPPDAKFGRLPSPNFSHVASSSSGLTFSLVNIEGRPPETTTAAKVYFMPKKVPTLLSTQRARELAARMGFTNPPKENTPTEYFYVDPLDTLRTFALNTTTLNFRYKYAYEKKGDLFESNTIISKDQAVGEVRTFIQSYGLFDGSILDGNIQSQYLTYDSGADVFRPSDSIAKSNSVRIDFWRKPIGEFPLVTPLFFQSYNYALYTRDPRVKIVDLSYAFWPIAFDNVGTYPLKTSDMAWQDLIDGYAPIVNMGENKGNTVIIRQIYLAYYDSPEPQMYLQPIFVFRGDNNFVAYLPAILPDWLE